MYHPAKYFAGLNKTQKKKKLKEMRHFGAMSWSDPKAYVGFKTDQTVKSKPSSYTQRWKAKFPKALSLKQKSDATGVPLKYIKKSFNRGMAAWRTGHRPGATQQQWGYARISSLLVCGKTHYGPDSDLVRKAKTRSARARKWFSRCARKN